MPAAPGPEPGRRSGQDPEHQVEGVHHQTAVQATSADAEDEDGSGEETGTAPARVIFSAR